MTREAFETALDSGQLLTMVQWRDHSQWYTCRRNGRTRTWKRDSDRFIIPIKYRYRDTMRVTERHFNNGSVDHWFRIGGAQ